MRGMGSAPAGLTASIKNSAVNNAGNAETGAVGNAFETQNRLNNTAYNPAIEATNAVSNSVNAATGAGSALNKAGSTLGDIGSGLSGLASIATSFLPPSAPMTNFNPNIWKSGPTYMPGGAPVVPAPFSLTNLPTG